jgi:4-amino-4-deoxy-L-arabinose transferase-like glycosyltransferase
VEKSRILWTLCIAISLGYFLLPNDRIDFTPFNAHDSESYIALASSMADGRGYTRSFDPDTYIPHTTWPPGLPVMILPSMWAGGDAPNLLLTKINTILVAVAGLWLAVAYVRRISGSTDAALLALVALGLNPFYWHYSRVVMTEVPAFVWIVGSLLVLDMAWQCRRRVFWALAVAGLVAGLGMLIRGSLIGLVVAPLAVAIVRSSSVFDPLKPPNLARYFVYAVGFSIPYIAWALRNSYVDASDWGFDGINQVRMLLASESTDPSSPLRMPLEIAMDAWTTVKWYAIYRLPQQIVPGFWLDEVWNAFKPFDAVAAALASAVIAIAALLRRLSLPLLMVALPMVLLNLLFTVGGNPRYWFPVSFMVILALCMTVAHAARNLSGTTRASAFLILVLAASANSIAYIVQHERHPYRNSNFHALAELYERSANVELGAVYAPNPHAFRIITGHRAPMARPENGLDPEVSHWVVKGDSIAHTSCRLGSVIIRSGPWVLVELNQLLPISALKLAEQECAAS